MDKGKQIAQAGIFDTDKGHIRHAPPRVRARASGPRPSRRVPPAAAGRPDLSAGRRRGTGGGQGTWVRGGGGGGRAGGGGLSDAAEVGDPAVPGELQNLRRRRRRRLDYQTTTKK